ncbi:MAG: Na+:solute symporter [Nitrospira sp.]|nr:Na+:solute symporter [Nitrospira sp.]
MKLTSIDWTIIALYMALSLMLGLYFTKRASSSTDEYFLSGRNLPWWLAGTSMVATTFSADTPLYVTGLVRSQGIYENWQWWCFVISGMLSVAVFAKLWKSAGVMTDVELTEMRYSGRPASILRGFKAIYFSVIIHTIIKAQVILAMAKILDVSLGWSKWQAIVISSAITIFYTIMSGYWGVIVTDFFQFIVAMFGALLIAYFAVDKVGGLNMLQPKMESLYGTNQHFTDIFPPMDAGFFSLPILTFIAYMGLSWWSKYSSDGGGVIVQRMVSCKNEKHAIGATFYFNTANYALRSWPWILVAIASLILYPAIKDHESVYPMMMVDLLPQGLRGLMLASFFAAFMSTLSTYLNLSSAYFINDFYRRFVKKDKTERHYILVTRISILILSVITAIATYYATSIVEVFKFLIAFGSGTGLVYLMRWFWWKINAWSEISAMIASTTTSSYIYIVHPAMPFYAKLFFIIFFSTLVWVLVTLFTKPVDRKHLTEFYKKARVGGIGWREIENNIQGLNISKNNLYASLKNWFYGCIFIYGITIGTGMFLFQRFTEGLIYSCFALISAIFVYRGFLK